MTRTLTIALLTLGDPSTLTGGYLFHQRLAELAPDHGARIDFVSFPHRPFPLAMLDAPDVLGQTAALDADVLVLDSIAAAFTGPAMLLGGPSVPLVGMLHQPPGGIDHGRLRSAVQARLDRLAYRRAARLLVASDSLAADLEEQGVARERLRVVPPGRDVATGHGQSPGDLRRGRQAAFLCVGNWVERKGIVDLLDAFALLPSNTATLHLVGDDHADEGYGDRIRVRLARPDLIDHVVVHGRKSREEVAALYAAADAFVLPSIREPFGTVYGEAMAFGLPVVGWRAGNLPYLADHGKEGLLVEPGDVAGLSNALHLLARDLDLRARLGEAAHARALKRPTWSDTARVFFDAVREVGSTEI